MKEIISIFIALFIFYGLIHLMFSLTNFIVKLRYNKTIAEIMFGEYDL